MQNRARFEGGYEWTRLGIVCTGEAQPNLRLALGLARPEEGGGGGANNPVGRSRGQLSKGSAWNVPIGRKWFSGAGPAAKIGPASDFKAARKNGTSAANEIAYRSRPEARRVVPGEWAGRRARPTIWGPSRPGRGPTLHRPASRSGRPAGGQINGCQCRRRFRRLSGARVG